MSVSTDCQSYLLPMMLVSHCSDTTVPHIPLAPTVFCCNQTCRGHIAMLILLEPRWIGAISSGWVWLGAVIYPIIALGMSHLLWLWLTWSGSWTFGWLILWGSFGDYPAALVGCCSSSGFPFWILLMLHCRGYVSLVWRFLVQWVLSIKLCMPLSLLLLTCSSSVLQQ